MPSQGRILSQPGQGMPLDMPADNPPGMPGGMQQDIDQDNLPGMAGGMQQDIDQDNPPGMPGGMQQDMPVDNQPGMAGGMQQDIDQDNPPGIPGGMPQDIDQDNPPGMPGGMQQDMPVDNPPGMPGGMQQDIDQDNPPGIPGGMPQDIYQDNPPGMPGGMPKDIKQDNPPGMPGSIQQDINQDNSPGMQGGMQQDNPPGIQQDMPLDMPQDNPLGMQGSMQQDMPQAMAGYMHQDMRHIRVLGVPVQETAEMGIGLRGEEVVYMREEQHWTQPQTMRQAVADAETVVPPWDEMQAGEHSGDGTQTGTQSGGGTQTGSQSGGGTRAKTNAGAEARVKTRGRTTVWAQAQYPTEADSTPQSGVQDWALPQEGAEAEAQLKNEGWALVIARMEAWAQSQGGARVNLPESLLQPQANVRGESGPSPSTRAGHAGEPLTRHGHHIGRMGGLNNCHRNVKLMTNYFSVNFLRSTPLYQYHVEYNPPCESKRVRTALLYVHQQLFSEVLAFDGTMLFLPRRLPNEVTEVHSTRHDGVQIRLTIRLRSELPPNAPQAIQVFNIILRRLLRQLGMDQVQRHHYDFGSSVNINSNQHTILQVIPGVAASILPFEDRVLLNVDLTHKVVQRDTCLDVINREYMKQTNMDDVRRALIGCIVITRYNNRTYRVDEVNDTLTPTDTFRLTDGTTITFQAYFQQHYQIAIVDQAQPLLMSRPTARNRRRGQTGPIYLVPELCLITGLSDEMRADFSVMKDVAVHTRIPPNDRVARLLRFRNTLETNQQARQEVENWGFGFSERLLEVPGHIFDKERITVGNFECHYNPKYPNWLHEMKHKELLVTVALRNWLILFPKKHDQIALHFVQSLEIAGRNIQMQISHPVKIALDDDRNETYLRALRNSVTSDVQMVVCIVSDSKKDRYNAIKRFCTCERPVPCQVVIQKNLAVVRLRMEMIRNIAIQLNCKLGGEAWTVHIPFTVPVMMVGIDTYPDMSMRNWSVCGVVCSINNICTRFYSRVIFYESHVELINRLMPICREALRKFQQIRDVLPEKIFIYRDGVRGGQLDAVVSRELPRVKESFRQYMENYSPRLSFIVVNKQINTRLFIRTTDVENPPPGTVVDSVITKKECYNFFLVSDSRCTLSPTHYTVIFDDTGLRREYLQRLTYKLTHLYYNMPRTIRVPAPCQYAHKLAFLVGQSLHREPSIHLADRLYYL